MKRLLHLSTVLATICVLFLTSCLKENSNIEPSFSTPGKIVLAGEIDQIYQTRVNDYGFCNGDQVGIYVVDYNGSAAGTLSVENNRADNVKHTFDEGANKWNPIRDIYWKDNSTRVDIYGYYPFGSPQSVTEYAFEVEKDQQKSAAYGAIGGYEASDFLWGKAESIAPTDRVISLSFGHKMASARITLAEGSGFGAGEWALLDKAVLVLNTKRNASINLSTGKVTATGQVPNTGTIPMKDNGEYRAIIVPQEVAVSIPLLSITVGGTPYLLTKEQPFTYTASKQHNFTITVNKRIQGGYEFVLTSESITAWENDNSSHDATAREYIIINVETAGTLAECITAAGKDISKVKNLKITGQINSQDFAYMRFRMPSLQSLNLKEVQIVAGEYGSLDNNIVYNNIDLEIPYAALSGVPALSRLVLPDNLKRIGDRAFMETSSLLGSIVIPEGVTYIGDYAFYGCGSLTGILSLPSTLEHIGDRAFFYCGVNCELKLPESLRHIGWEAFYGGQGFYGSLILPSNLEYIGSGAFQGCTNLTGSLKIPFNIKVIRELTFYSCGFNGTLTLHNEITSIGSQAFSYNRFRGELKLPEELVVIADWAFHNCDFSGVLKIPESVESIGSHAFGYNWRLRGVLEMSRNIQSIGSYAFAECKGIEGLMFNRDLEIIGNGAFENCYGVGEIVCKGNIPPIIGGGAFDGVPKDNFSVEVPESSVSQYQTAAGWRDFKRIGAYRELSTNLHTLSAINTNISRDLILRAESDWTIESKPEWISLNKTSGTGFTELKVTFSEMAKGSETREGEVVFKLTDKEYRTSLKVIQFDYQYEEDQILTLQSATKGNGVNIVFLGDGYSAKEVSEGKYLTTINEAVGHFFNIVPYKTYRDYFNVYTGIAVSTESGIGGINTVVNNKFTTYAKGGMHLGPFSDDGYSKIFEYACKAPTVTEANIDITLIVMVANTAEYAGICYMFDQGAAIAYCPVSDYEYPFDFRGLVQHEAGGHGFGKLGDEYILHNAFIDWCNCLCCPHVPEFLYAKSLGFYDNLSLSGKPTEVPWKHFITHSKYNQIVDIFEGGFMHSRGVFRSEQGSCMINNIPYYNAISREAMVKRIKKYAGEVYSFEEFVAKDVLEATEPTKSARVPEALTKVPTHTTAPVFMGKRPKLNLNK